MIKRVARNTRYFTYEGDKYGVRAPLTGEMKEITDLMAEYQRTVRKEVKDAVADNIVDYTRPNGDLSALAAVQIKVCENFVVVDGVQLFGTGEGQEKISEVPWDFVMAAWYCYNNQADRPPFKSVAIQDLLPLNFMREHSIVPVEKVEEYLVELEAGGNFDKAHDIRVALELVKPPTGVAETDPLPKPTATKTLPSDATSSA